MGRVILAAVLLALGSVFGQSMASGVSPVRDAVPCPADFDEFWQSSIRKLEGDTPLDLKVERESASSRPEFDYFKFSFATVGRRMWGFMTVPTDKTKGKFPFLLRIPGAGPYHAGWWGGNGTHLTMMVNVLDFDPNGPAGIEADYNTMCKRLKAKYGYAGDWYLLAGMAASREEVFAYPVLLGLNRIVEWVWNRPDVDRSCFSVIGGSQGGYLTIALLGINRRFTRAVAYVPAGGDLLGDDFGRVPGYPQPLRNYPADCHDAIRRIAPYFDAVNFAARNETPLRGARGLSDSICSPSSTKLIFDALKGEKHVIDCPGMTHAVFPEVEKELAKWARSRTLRVSESAAAGNDASVRASGEFHE